MKSLLCSCLNRWHATHFLVLWSFCPSIFLPCFVLFATATCLTVQSSPVLSVWTSWQLHSAARLLPLVSIEMSCLECSLWRSEVRRKLVSSFVLGVHRLALPSSVFSSLVVLQSHRKEASNRQGFFFFVVMFASLLIVSICKVTQEEASNRQDFYFVCCYACFLPH